MDLQLVIVLTLLAGVLFAFVRGAPAPEFAALAAFAALPALGVLSLEEAAGVFTAQAPLTIAMMFVMSAALERTGCVEMVGGHVSRLAGRSYLRALLLLMGAAMLCSAAMNNTPVVIIMIPLALSLAQTVGVSASRLLMPLSFAAIFGGSATLIGASANVLVSDSAAAHGAAPFGMFDMTGPGLIFAAAGVLYMLLIGRHLLPDRTPPPKPVRRAATARTTPSRSILSGVQSVFGLGSVAPASAALGPGQVNRAAAGSTLNAGGPVAVASPAATPAAEGAKTWGCEGDYCREKAPIAVGVSASVMVLAALGAAPILHLAALGAAAAVLSGCVSPRHAVRAVDWRLIMMIFGMLGLSLGLEKLGATAALAEFLVGFGRDQSPVQALLLLYAATSIVTALVTNNAVALMMAPVALALAQQMNVNPTAFLMAVMFAASASFATPIGYQTNMIAHRAGGYRFHDFLVVGAPLNILFALLAALILPWFFPF